MKILRSFLVIFVIGLSALFAKEATPFPDLSTALPTEKLSKQVKLAGFEIYIYATDSEFAKLKKKFSGFLGADWTEVKLNPKSKKTINEAAEAVKAKGGVMEGVAIVSNPEFPGTHILLQQMKKKSESKKTLVITVIRN